MTYRLYTEEENNIVKVWTPETIADPKYRTVSGFDSGVLEIDDRKAELLGITEREYRAVVYVDNAMSVCRNTSGWNSVLCEEHIKDGILYRCFFCHEDEQSKYCKATNSAGRRCAQQALGWGKESSWKLKYSDEGQYCRFHEKEKEKLGFKFSLSGLDKWLEGWQYETVMLWKRNFIYRLERLERVAFSQIMQIKEVLDKLNNKEIRPRDLPSKTNVYFIYCDGYVKIGRSRDPEKRFAALCSETDKTIRPAGIDMKNAKLLGSIVGDVYVEGGIHSRLYEKRVAGEWFKYDTEIATLIEILIGSGDMTVEWLLSDIVKSYDSIIGHDSQGGYDYKETKESIDLKEEQGIIWGVQRREEQRLKEYGF